MTGDNIIQDWKKGQFKAIYWLEGDEPFLIDQVMEYAENHILTEAEMGFNLTVFYGRDADWPAVINACRRYPMFAEKQVVLLKEAQAMKDIEKLESYIENPLGSTIFVVGYKDKKVDKRTKLAKSLKSNGEIVTTSKLWDNDLPVWTKSMVKSRGFTIDDRAVSLLVENIGNDLSRLWNELGKVSINLQSRTHITEDDIEQYVGISKEYNSLELQAALAQRNLTKCLQIAQFMEANPKALPLQMVLPSLYTYFSKAYLVFGAATNNEYEIAQMLGYKGASSYVKDIINCARSYRQKGVEHAIMLMHECNLRSIGINNTGATSDSALLKEMVVKMIQLTQASS